jgi:ribosomal protein S6E (S10)
VLFESLGERRRGVRGWWVVLEVVVVNVVVVIAPREL